MCQEAHTREAAHRTKQVWRGTYVEYVVVEENHDDAGDVEGREGRVDDEVAVVEETEVLSAVGRVVQAEYDGTAYSS